MNTIITYLFKLKLFLITGISWLLYIAISMYLSIGEKCPAYTMDWTLPVYSFFHIGGFFVLGILSGIKSPKEYKFTVTLGFLIGIITTLVVPLFMLSHLGEVQEAYVINWKFPMISILFFGLIFFMGLASGIKGRIKK